MSPDPMEREEIEALLATRQELGSGMEPALVDSFANKIIAEVQRQTNAQLPVQKPPEKSTGGHLALAIVSLVMAIPLTAMALEASSWMVIVIWLGIVLVNIAYSMRYRSPS